MGRSGRAQATGRWALVAAVLVLLVVPGRLLARDHESDDALVPYAAASAVEDRVATGRTWRSDAGVVVVDDDRIRVVEVRPRITVDTAEADVDIRLCLPDGSCVTSEVPGHGKVRLAPGAARLEVAVTPRHAGQVHIEGFDVTYVDGGRRGTEHAGVPIRLRVV